MFDIPVIDDQEFDWEAEQERVERCIANLRNDMRRMHGDMGHLNEAVALLEAYADELEGNR